jgi:bifunctional non-homologous end joining protein LigD
MPFPFGFVPPCLPTKAPQPPTGSLWLHEIKHDGFRVIARKDGDHVRLHSRPGNSLTDRFPLIVEALLGLRSRSCIIDSEAVCCDDKGVPSFNRIRYRRYDGSVFLYALDLIELNGDDLRREPLEVRKATLASVLAKAAPGVRLNEHIEADGATVFAHACKMSLEGIWLALHVGPLTGLAQDQEPGRAGGAAGARRRLARPKTMVRAGAIPTPCAAKIVAWALTPDSG